MNKPKISVITVVYNMKDLMEKNIKNVLEQSYENTEFVVIDGGSNDGTMDVINKYKDQIDVIVSEPDKGIYDAMNKGWKKASGEYVYFLNVGDLFINANVLSKVVSVLGNENPDFFYGNVILLDQERGYSSLSSKRISLKEVKRGNKIVHQAVVMKRTMLEKVNGFSLKYALSADYDMLCKVCKITDSIIYADIDIINFDISGASANLAKAYMENQKVVQDNFGLLWGVRYFVIAVTKIIGERVFGVLGGKALIDKVRMMEVGHAKRDK